MTPLDGKDGKNKSADFWWKSGADDNLADCALEPREGFACPSCLLGELHYNGLFLLVCDNCGRVAEAGVFT